MTQHLHNILWQGQSANCAWERVCGSSHRNSDSSTILSPPVPGSHELCKYVLIIRIFYFLFLSCSDGFIICFYFYFSFYSFNLCLFVNNFLRYLSEYLYLILITIVCVCVFKCADETGHDCFFLSCREEDIKNINLINLFCIIFIRYLAYILPLSWNEMKSYYSLAWLVVGVCSRWRDAASNTSFHLRVLSVESGAKDQVNSGTLVLGPHTYTCISDALACALPGDTISLCVGHHWESTLTPRAPVRLISGELICLLVIIFT